MAERSPRNPILLPVLEKNARGSWLLNLNVLAVLRPRRIRRTAGLAPAPGDGCKVTVMCRVQSGRVGTRLLWVSVFSVIGVVALGFAFATLGRSRMPFAPGVHAVGVERPVDVVLGEVRTIQCHLFNNLERTIEIDSVSTG